MKCLICGCEYGDKQKKCPDCGFKSPIDDANEMHPSQTTTIQNGQQLISGAQEKDKNNTWLIILSFFIPPIGLLYFLSNRKDLTKQIQRCGIASLVGFAIITMILLSIFGVLGKDENNKNDITNSINHTQQDDSSKYENSYADGYLMWDEEVDLIIDDIGEGNFGEIGDYGLIE